MREIILSASVSLVGRGDYYKTSNPFLIQCAVRELVIAVIRCQKIVWGGHPSITPMIWTICEDLNVDYSEKVILYQSRYFEDRFPEDNKRFNNLILTDSIVGDQEASLLLMRRERLSRKNLCAAVFIGGMEGVKEEYHLFRQYHSHETVLPVAAPGGAALELAKELGHYDESHLPSIDFASLFHKNLKF